MNGYGHSRFLTTILVGIPIAVLIAIFTLALSVGLAAFERTLARVLLRVDVPVSSLETDRTNWGRLKRLVIDRWTWAAAFYLVSVFFVGTAVFTFLSSVLVTAGSLVLTPLYYTYAPASIYLGPTPVFEFTPQLMFGWNDLLVGLETTIRIEAWQVTSLPEALLVAIIGVVLMLLSLQLCNSIAWLWGRYMQMMLRMPRYWTRSN